MSRATRRAFLRATGIGLVAGTVSRALPADAQAGREDAAVDDMVLIPAGRFIMGTTEAQAAELAEEHGYHVSWFAGEVPTKEVELAAYRIDRFPVTCAQYAEFCQATGHAPPMGWRNGQPPRGLADHPVTSVNRADARAHSAWAGKRLPTEAQWEKAARGESGLVFPWGNEFDPEACQFRRDPMAPPPGTSSVTAHPKGASPYGVMDTVGNVLEWCEDSPGPGSGFLKGGCYLFEEIVNLRAASRIMSGFDNNPLAFYGFRCVLEVA